MDMREAPIALGLVALLAVDVTFIGINLAALDTAGVRHIPDFLFVGGEWSLPEIVQYAKWALLAVILAVAFYRSRELIYGVWAAAFTAITLDDALDLHVRAGAALRRIVLPGDPPGLWELVPMSIAVSAVLAALWYVHRRRDRAERARQYSRRALALGVLFGVFAVGVDAMHSLYRRVAPREQLGDTYLLTDTLFEMLEDGGELITATIILAYTIWHFRRWGERQRAPEEPAVAG